MSRVNALNVKVLLFTLLLPLSAHSLKGKIMRESVNLIDKAKNIGKNMDVQGKVRAGELPLGSLGQAPDFPSKVMTVVDELSPELKLELAALRRYAGFFRNRVSPIREAAYKRPLTPEEMAALSLNDTIYEDMSLKLRYYQSHVRVKQLEDIYANGWGGRSKDDILKQAERTDRILVAVIDTGIDYNHPFLAYKVPRLSKEEIEEIGHHKILKGLEMYKYRDMVEFDIRRLREQYVGHSNGEAMANGLESNLKDAKKIAMRASIGWDFQVNDHLPYDIPVSSIPTHGTHVAGVIVRDTDDVAILPIRKNYLVDNGIRSLREELEFASERGARVVNVGAGIPNILHPKQLSSDIMAQMTTVYKVMNDNPHILFVIGSGNAARNNDIHPFYPASLRLPNVISVAAADGRGGLQPMSNYGKKSVHVAAPGKKILSAAAKEMGEANPSVAAKEVGEANPSAAAKEVGEDNPALREQYVVYTGTSFAAPFVSRVAARILHINPKLTPVDVIDIIKRSVTKVDALEDKLAFGGVVNEERALELAEATL